MSTEPSTSTSHSNLQPIFNAALKEYKHKTKEDPTTHPLLPCHSVKGVDNRAKGVEGKVQDVCDGVQHARGDVQDVRGDVQDVDHKVLSVSDSRVQGVDHQLDRVSRLLFL